MSGATDVLKLARENPEQARRLVATMMSQASKNISKINQELEAVRTMLQQLAAEKFSKKALKKSVRELRKKRDAIAAMKLRLFIGQRKMALLQQLAGKLGDPRLEKKLDRLLHSHRRLKTDWGRRHHLLEMAEMFFGDDGETPEPLRDVMRVGINTGFYSEAIGDAVPDILPSRVIAEVIARTLDGTTVPEEDQRLDLRVLSQTIGKGELGRTLQTWNAMGEIMGDALARDPFKKGDPGDEA